MKKKVVSVFLAMTMVAAMAAGCGGNNLTELGLEEGKYIRLPYAKVRAEEVEDYIENSRSST